LKILIACEESQAVTKKIRKLGHESYSCEIIECSGGHPKWHKQDDDLKVFSQEIIKPEWDMVIAFPPRTDLCVSGTIWFEEKIIGKFAVFK